MTQHDPRIRIRHMRDHAVEAIEMLGDVTVEELRNDRKLQLALVQLIEIVGEAASRVPDDVRATHPGVPWQLAADMRDKRIHGYDVIEYGIVFDRSATAGVVKHRVPCQTIIRRDGDS